VVNGAVDEGVTFHLPSLVSGAALAYALAVPPKRYSDCS
jgi:hypothetical protein